jgi:hypothetical protein
MKKLPPLIRATKLAKALDIDHRTVYSLIESGAIEGKSLCHPSGRKAWFVTSEAYLNLITSKPDAK